MSNIAFSGPAEGWFNVTGGGRMAQIRLDRECSDFNWVIGKQVLLDGKEYRVRGVVRAAHVAPWRRGEFIELVIAE